MLNNPMPYTAHPVVRQLVRDGIKLFPASIWRSKLHDGKHMRCAQGKCPMGLHPCCAGLCPCQYRDFPIYGMLVGECERAQQEFARWWDCETDAAAALAEIERVKGVVA